MLGMLEQQDMKRLGPGAHALHFIAEAGRLLGILLHDHVIVSRTGHVSFKAKGLI